MVRVQGLRSQASVPMLRIQGLGFNAKLTVLREVCGDFLASLEYGSLSERWGALLDLWIAWVIIGDP